MTPEALVAAITCDLLHGGHVREFGSWGSKEAPHDTGFVGGEFCACLHCGTRLHASRLTREGYDFGNGKRFEGPWRWHGRRDGA